MWPPWQPSIGWQPPFCIRSSSGTPSSNSWLPTPLTSIPIELRDSIVGSSWNSAETSGLAPIMSPAPTVIVFVFCVRRSLIHVARYAMPPAGTACGAQPVCTPFVRTGLQQPTWIVPGVVGWRWPCRSLIASSCTLVEFGAAFDPLAASACDVPTTSISPRAARTAIVRLIKLSPSLGFP